MEDIRSLLLRFGAGPTGAGRPPTTYSTYAHVAYASRWQDASFLTDTGFSEHSDRKLFRILESSSLSYKSVRDDPDAP